MGAQCHTITPNKIYSQYFRNINISSLRDQWSTAMFYKIKKIFETFSEKDSQNQQYIDYEGFKKLFTSFSNYQQIHKKRLFQIFDQQNIGIINWNNFYTSISIVYYAQAQILSIIMFMIFDEHLQLSLTEKQFTLLCNFNKHCINTNEMSNQYPLYEPEEIIQMMSIDKKQITVDHWLKQSKKFFNFQRFRQDFNIFDEEKVEKELVYNFEQWNTYIDPEKSKYEAYLISYKWFENWKTYVLQKFGTQINLQTVRNKNSNLKIQSFHSIDISSKNIANIGRINRNHQLNLNQTNKNASAQDIIKNYNFVYSNIGQKPGNIYNQALQGQYSGILKPNLIQHRDFAIVSKKVWNNLKFIYNGNPQFRRTGIDAIELYPKIIQTYFQIRENLIDYKTEKIFRVFSSLSIKDFLSQVLQFNQKEMKSKSVIFKSDSTLKWTEIDDDNATLGQLTLDTIVFIVITQKQRIRQFLQFNSKAQRTIQQATVGDVVIFRRQSNYYKKQERSYVNIGKTKQGKIILHSPGESYAEDLHLLQSDLYKNAILKPYEETSRINTLILNKKQKEKFPRIQSKKNLRFVASFFQELICNKQMRQMLILHDKKTEIDGFLSFLVFLLNMKFDSVKPGQIWQIFRSLLPQYREFQISMCQNFILEFLNKLRYECVCLKVKDVISQDFMFCMQRELRCGKCKKITTLQHQQMLITLPLPQESLEHYVILYVPYTLSQNKQLKNYHIQLSKNSKLKEFKDLLEKEAKLGDKNYALVQVYENDIIKNFMEISDDTILEDICIWSESFLVAYELCTNFDSFISKHYNKNKEIQEHQLKVGQYIDFKDQEKGWMFGKISQITHYNYVHTYDLSIRYQLRSDEVFQTSFIPDDDNLYPFPVRSYRNAEHYYVRLVQRSYNEPSNRMKLCNFPLIVVIANWMRLRQFHYLIYLQMRRFISQQQQHHKQKQNKQSLNKKFDKKLNFKKQAQLKEFKQYLNSSEFPYHLNFVDQQGRCAICFKRLKIQLLAQQEKKYCKGCKLSTSQPISWQIKITEVMVCVDWKNNKSMKKISKNTMSEKAQKTQINLQKLLCSEVNQMKQQFRDDLICCHGFKECSVLDKFLTLPENLIIMLKRINTQNNYTKLIKDKVQIEFDNLEIQSENYKLNGIISVEGLGREINYKHYMLHDNQGQQQWLERDGQILRVVNRQIVESCCSFVFFYRKKQGGFKKKNINKCI